MMTSSHTTLLNLEEKNLVTIKGPIDDDSSDKFFSDLEKFDDRTLNIYIDSPGGSVINGLKMIDYIHTLQSDNIVVNCYANFAASMAFILLQNCDNRFTSTSGILMQHQMSLGIKGDIQNLKNYLKMIDSINDNINVAQAKRLNLTTEQYNYKVMNDWWVSGFTAVNDKVVDELVDVKCSPNLYKKKSNLEKNTFFGTVKLVFSKCPLLQKPLDIKYKITFPNEEDFENSIYKMYDMYDMNYYISEPKRIKMINI